ncbi:MAG TPA: hypothetical protein VFI47_22470, partial [Acidimicrobiales bacterium]|nr:hypothetical protein [Acidimicrobiales bacterium]
GLGRLGGVLVVLAVVAGAGCGSDEGAGEALGGALVGDRQAYVDAIVAASEGDGELDAGQVTCLARGYVDGVGTGVLREAGITPESIRDDPDANPTDAGLALTTAQAEAIYDEVSGCLDVQALMVYSLTTASAMPEAAKACVAESLSEDLAEDMFVAIYTSGAEAFERPGTPLYDQYEREVGPCLEVAGG